MGYKYIGVLKFFLQNKLLKVQNLSFFVFKEKTFKNPNFRLTFTAEN